MITTTKMSNFQVSEDLMFLKSDDNAFSFVHVHEVHHNHLYHVTCSSRDRREVKLTEGEWSVTSLLGVTDNTVYFHAQMNPLQQHMYSVSLDTPGVTKQLTPDGYFHTCTLNHSMTKFASVYSNSHTHYQCSVFCLESGDKLRTITPTLNFGEVYLKKSSVGSVPSVGGGGEGDNGITTYRYDTPIIEKMQLDEQDVYYMIYPAKGVDLSQPQPVLLYVYGGPAIQLVVDRYMR